MKVHFRDKNNRGIINEIPPPLLDLTKNLVLNAFVVENGQRPDSPDVFLVSSGETGSAIIQTTLEEYLSAGVDMLEIATNRWKWKRPGRFDNLKPYDRDAVKDSLERLRGQLEVVVKELEEWED